MEMSGKEADGLISQIHKAYDARRCNVFRRRRTKIAIFIMIALTVVLGVLITVSLLLFKSVIYPPSPLDLCKETGYVVVPLGIYGGIKEGDLSSFLLSQAGSPYMIALDAGSLFTGVSSFVEQIQNSLQQARHTYSLFDFPSWAISSEQKVGWIMKNKIVGYFIGHPHLDHLMGLLTFAPEDYYINADGNATQPAIPKSIIGLNSTLSAIQTNLFNGVVWADFPSFGRYNYENVADGTVSNLSDLLGNVSQGHPLGPNDFPNNITVSTYQTCHDTLNSSAFLFTFSDSTQLVFFSDTGIPSTPPLDRCDWSGRILSVWKSVNLQKIRAIIIEVSFPNNTPDSAMFGHLRPKDLLSQLAILAKINGVSSLSSLTVIVQHIKPILGDPGINAFQSDAIAIIKSQLLASNSLDVKFIFPQQGQHICV